MSVHGDARVLAEEPLAVGRDLDADPGAQLGVLAADALRQTVADPRVLDVDRRTARLAQAVEQIGVLVPQHQRRVEELAGRVGELVEASLVIAKHQAAKSKRIGPSIVSGNDTGAPASSAARSGGHQPGSGSTSSFITTTYGVRAARTPALTGEANPWGGHPLSMITISWATSVVAWTAAMQARTRSDAASSVGITTVNSGCSPAGRRAPPVRAPGADMRLPGDGDRAQTSLGQRK